MPMCPWRWENNPMRLPDALPTCPGCGQPVEPIQWARCVPVTRAGRRAHKACLERGFAEPVHDDDCGYYILAPVCTAPALLQTGASFWGIVDAQVVIRVPA